MSGTVLDLVDAGVTRIVMPADRAASPSEAEKSLLDDSMQIDMLKEVLDWIVEGAGRKRCSIRIYCAAHNIRSKIREVGE